MLLSWRTYRNSTVSTWLLANWLGSGKNELHEIGLSDISNFRLYALALYQLYLLVAFCLSVLSVSVCLSVSAVWWTNKDC